MISIVIATYEQKGEGAKFFSQLLRSIENQRISVPYEIIISDNATDGSIKAVCDSFSLPISYHFNPVRGASQNINNAIDLATFDKVKIMCQDDMFIGNAIDKFCQALDSHGWVISNSKHIDGEGRERGQRITKYIHGNFDANITGMPSVTAFRKSSIRFNPNLRTVVDMYFYHQLFELYGQPGVLKDFNIAQRFHNASLSRNQPSYHQRDVNWLIRKGMIPGKIPKVIVAVVVYDRTENIERWVHCWQKCETESAELWFIHNTDTGANHIDFYQRLVGKYPNNEKVINSLFRNNIGYDIGAFQDVCRGRLSGFPKDWDYLIWCTDDTVPMEKDFVSQYLNAFDKKTGLVCMHLSKEITPHVRTTGFCIPVKVAARIKFPADPITTIQQCYQFEHRGKETLMNQVVRMGLNIVQVTPLSFSPLYDMNYWNRNEEAKKLRHILDRQDQHEKQFYDKDIIDILQAYGDPPYIKINYNNEKNR